MFRVFLTKCVSLWVSGFLSKAGVTEPETAIAKIEVLTLTNLTIKIMSIDLQTKPGKFLFGPSG